MDTQRSVKRTVDGATYTVFLNNGVRLWNAKTGETSKLPALRWCVDLPIPAYYDWITGNLVDPCTTMDRRTITKEFGQVPVSLFDMNDAGNVMIGRMVRSRRASSKA